MTVRIVEWFVMDQLPPYVTRGATPTIWEIREILNSVLVGDSTWSGPALSFQVAEAVVKASLMLMNISEEISFSVDNCPSPQEISPITTTHVFFSSRSP